MKNKEKNILTQAIEYQEKQNKNYKKSIELLKELVEFGNQIPNNYGRTKNHYELLSKVNKFLKEQEDENN